MKLTLSWEIDQNSLLFSIAIFLLIGITCIVYWPGLSGIFLLDDYQNLKTINEIGGVTDLKSALYFIFGNHSGSTGRPVSMLSFLINDQYWPGSARSYKYTNLMIHILCGLLIFLFTRKLLLILNAPDKNSNAIALFCCALWLLHPFNVSTTLYVIQRMTQLSTMFSLTAVLFYLYGRCMIEKKPKQSLIIMSLGLGFFGLLALFSKENGVLLLIYLLVLEFTLLNQLKRPLYFKFWFSIFVVIPLIIVIAVFIHYDFFFGSYAKREFSLPQRILTEARILVNYLYYIVLPNIRGTGLIHDDLVLSKSLIDPITTLFSVSFLFALLVLAFAFLKKQAVLSFAILWFLGGHLLESTIIPLELYFEHRNYMAMIGPLFAIAYYLAKLYSGIERKAHKNAIVAFTIGILSFSGFITHLSANTWSNPVSLFSVWAYEHPNSLRAQRIYGQMLAINDKPNEAIVVLENAYKDFPYDVSLPIEIMNISCVNNIRSPYSLNAVTKLQKPTRFTDGVWATTQSFVNNIVTNKCSRFNFDDAHKLLESIANINGIHAHKNTLAQLYFLRSDIYVMQRKLQPAIELLDKAYKYQKTITIPLRQAYLLASAGLYSESQQYLDIARQVDARRRRFAPSQLDQIAKLEASILNRGTLDNQKYISK